ncbi:MAG: hypothetical protein D6814_00835, partial [Calditrichaeota bacterium]
IVALWTQLYGIPLDFKKSILPHGKLGQTACPGNHFPHDIFHELIKNYANKWSQDPAFQAALKKFKAIPRVFA